MEPLPSPVSSSVMNCSRRFRIGERQYLDLGESLIQCCGRVFVRLAYRLLLLFGLAAGLDAATIVSASLSALLTTGSLAGVSFPVSYSYDASQVLPVGDSFINLESFDFTLLGVPFHRSDIFQGGQVIFRNCIEENVTASFQVILPPNSPVENITFGFGGPGVIAYIDLSNQFGQGTFAFGTVPEPATAPLLLSALIGMVIAARRGCRLGDYPPTSSLGRDSERQRARRRRGCCRSVRGLRLRRSRRSTAQLRCRRQIALRQRPRRGARRATDTPQPSRFEGILFVRQFYSQRSFRSEFNSPKPAQKWRYQAISVGIVAGFRLDRAHPPGRR
jgi:hypothetical protein